MSPDLVEELLRSRREDLLRDRHVSPTDESKETERVIVLPSDDEEGEHPVHGEAVEGSDDDEGRRKGSGVDCPSVHHPCP